MGYFNPVPRTLGELKKAYRKLSHEHHPDAGGSGEVMAAINAEYTELFRFIKSVGADAFGGGFRDETETPDQLIRLMNQLIKAQKWLDDAEGYFAEAEYLLQTADRGSFGAYWQCCYSAAVNYVTALIVFKCKDPPDEDDLLRLTEICEETAKIDLTDIRPECARLTELCGFNDDAVKGGTARQAYDDTERIRYFATGYLEEFFVGKEIKILFIED